MLGVFEHDGVTTMEIRSFHGEHPVADLQGILHGFRGDDEHLTNESTQHSGDDESTHDDKDNFDGP